MHRTSYHAWFCCWTACAVFWIFSVPLVSGKEQGLWSLVANTSPWHERISAVLGSDFCWIVWFSAVWRDPRVPSTCWSTGQSQEKLSWRLVAISTCKSPLLRSFPLDYQVKAHDLRVRLFRYFLPASRASDTSAWTIRGKRKNGDKGWT